MKRFALLALLVAGVLNAQIPLEIKGGDVKTIEIDKIVIVKVPLQVISSFPFTVNAPAADGLFFWSYGPGVSAIDQGETLKVTAAPKGSMTVSVKSIGPKLDKDGKFLGFVTHLGSVTFSVGGIPDPPTPPVPPPVPPDPPPSPAPIPGEGLRVLFIFDAKKATTLPEAQQQILYGQTIRDYLNSKCSVGPDGKQREWRIFPKNVEGAEKIWMDALARPRASDLWMIVGNGSKGGCEVPLPNSVEEAMTIIRKYGG